MWKWIISYCWGCNFSVKILEMGSLDWKVNVFAVLLCIIKFPSIGLYHFASQEFCMKVLFCIILWKEYIVKLLNFCQFDGWKVYFSVLLIFYYEWSWTSFHMFRVIKNFFWWVTVHVFCLLFQRIFVIFYFFLCQRYHPCICDTCYRFFSHLSFVFCFCLVMSYVKQMASYFYAVRLFKFSFIVPGVSHY